MSEAIELAKKCRIFLRSISLDGLEAYYAATIQRGRELEREKLSKQEPIPGDYVYYPDYDYTAASQIDTAGRYVPANEFEIKDGLSIKLYAKPIP